MDMHVFLIGDVMPYKWYAKLKCMKVYAAINLLVCKMSQNYIFVSSLT